MRKVISVLLALIGLALLTVSITLTAETRTMAQSATAPEPSGLWTVVIERGIFSFVAMPEDGSSPKPADLARKVTRGLYGIGGVGLFFLVAGTVFFLRSGRGRGEGG